MAQKPTFSYAATIFTVNDPIASIKFYCDILGLEETPRWKELPEYVVLDRNGASIHLRERSTEKRMS